MEVVFLEDPACSWCWAFQPVDTAFAFEYGERLRPRRVMGGLRDYPIADVSFALGQWRLAEEVSGMPFDPGVWKEHVLRTTFVACRAVKAAHMTNPGLAVRFLRRLREAFYVERQPIDDMERILPLAVEVGFDVDRLRDHLDSGRADALFQRDRAEASRHGFGFPTILIRTPSEDAPTLLQGIVPFSSLAKALDELGFPPGRRRRFHDVSHDWGRLFKLRPRLTFPELLQVTRMKREALEKRLREVGAGRDGPFYTLEPSAVEELKERPRLAAYRL